MLISEAKMLEDRHNLLELSPLSARNGEAPAVFPNLFADRLHHRIGYGAHQRLNLRIGL